MATTKRDQILDALLLRLKTVNSKAVRNHIRLLDEGLPALSVWDESEADSGKKYGKQSLRLIVNVAYADYLPPSSNPSKIGNAMLGKLIAAAIGTDSSLGGLAESVRYQSSQIDYPEAGGDWIIAVDMSLEINYEIVLGNPYN